MPKTMKRFCRYKCRKHTTHKVIQYNDKNENNHYNIIEKNEIENDITNKNCDNQIKKL